jgi:hypothetical protein
VPLRNPKDTFSFGKVPVVRVPSKGVAIDVGKAQTLTMAGLSLEIAAGTDNVQIDPFAPYIDFRVAKVPIDKLALGLDAGLGLQIIYGVGPQNTVLAAPAKLTLPNEKSWPAGAAVEVYQHNWEQLKGMPVLPGEWWKVATGKVTADGKSIVTDAGTGVTAFGLIGVKRAP